MVMQKLKDKKPEVKEHKPDDIDVESPPVSGLMARRT